jgi:hypothetical protein
MTYEEYCDRVQMLSRQAIACLDEDDPDSAALFTKELIDYVMQHGEQFIEVDELVDRARLERMKRNLRPMFALVENQIRRRQ